MSALTFDRGPWGWTLAFYPGRRGVVISKHDNCEDWEQRRLWIKLIGLIQPIWIWKPYRKTFEIGLEIAGVRYSAFFE